MTIRHGLLCALLFLIVCSDKTNGYSKNTNQYGWKPQYSYNTKPNYNQQNNHYYNSISGDQSIYRPNSKTQQFSSSYPNIGWNYPSHQTSPNSRYNYNQIGNNPVNHPSSQVNINPYHPQTTSYNYPVHSSNSNGINSHYNVPAYYPTQNGFNTVHPSSSQNFPYIPHANGVIISTYPPKYKKVVRTVHHYHHNDPHRQNYNYQAGTHNPQILPENKILVSDESLPSSTTHCGMTLCSEVINYPLYEIEDVIKRARRMFNSGLIHASLRLKGISLQNLTSKYDTFWYGMEAPDHRFVDFSSSCREHVYTYHPREGYSTDNNTYYVVNVPSLRQGLTNIECESTYQICSKKDVPASETRSCHQMFREEQLLVLPSNKRVFNIEHFELKMFHVPTGCACIAST